MKIVVTVTDRISHKEGSSTVDVVPVCVQENPKCKDLCLCECGPDGGGFCPRPPDVACETSP